VRRNLTQRLRYLISQVSDQSQGERISDERPTKRPVMTRHNRKLEQIRLPLPPEPAWVQTEFQSWGEVQNCVRPPAREASNFTE
jgi:hypothetical protein